jgi:hypothetical protein
MHKKVSETHPVDVTLFVQLMLTEVALLSTKLAQERAQHNQLADVTLTAKLDFLINYLQIRPVKSDALWWYLACAVLFRISQTETATRTELLLMLEAIEHITSTAHKKGIHYWIIKYGGQHSLFTLQDTQRLDAVFPAVPWRHVALSTLSRHHFVYKQLNNKNYFEKITNYTGPITDPKKLFIEIAFSDGTTHRMEFTKQMLLIYAAHIHAPAPPILKVNFPDITGTGADNINIELRQNLRRLKHCNARGHLHPSFFTEKSTVIRGQIIRAIEHCGLITSEHSRAEYLKRLSQWDHKTNQPEYTNRLLLMKKLSGFNPQHTLHFFHSFLIETPFGLPTEIRNTIQETIKQCLYYSDQAEKILTGKYAVSKKYKILFELAKAFVNELVTSQNTRILNVGTPILPGEKYSGHAIYVAFKFTAANQVRIIISNGGLGVRQFHRSTTTGIERDAEEYDYAAFEVLSLTPANQEKLSHYVYRIMQTRYTQASTGPGEGKGNGSNRNANSFDDIVRDIYLRIHQVKEPSYFRGYQFKPFYLQRDDLQQSLLAQFTGNCTIHNLKKALQIAYDMDDTLFGKLEDNLIIGFDQKVTQWAMQL